MEKQELENIMLQYLNMPGASHSLFNFLDKIKEDIPEEMRLPAVLSASIWNLVIRGLVYFDIVANRSSYNWLIYLTKNGIEAAKGGEYNPNDPAGFAERIREDVPTITETEEVYMVEALNALKAAVIWHQK